MTRKTITAGAYVAAAVMSLAVAPRSLGQAAPAAEPATGTPAAESEEIVVLSPFVIQGSEDKGYRATSTLAGTRIKTSLSDVGSAISVVTEQFMQDTASRKAEELLVYATSTEVAGQGGSFAGGGDGNLVDTTRHSPVSNTRVRGLVEADNTRNFFLTDIPWDSYNVGRVDLQRGPNAILFGIGSPAGIVNSGLNDAAFTDANTVEAAVGSFGTTRISGDFNKVLLEDELSLRVSLLRDDTKYKQDPAFRLDKRVYAAFRWDPKFLRTDSARTSLRANFETGKIRGNAPRTTPPMDAITPWFSAMGKAGYDQRYVDKTDATSLATSSTAGASNNANGTRYQPWLGSAGNRVYDGIVAPWTPAGGQGSAYASSPRQWPDSNGTYPLGQITRGIVTYNSYAMNAKLNGYQLNPFKAKSLTDASIFDFYTKLLEGDNKREWTEFDAYNVALEQTFLDNRVGFELVYDNQDTKWGQRRYLAGDAASITVDVMHTLADGTANPNFGKPMVVAGGGSAGGDWTERKREVMRATAFATLDFADFMDKKSVATRILGKHTFTGLYTAQENKTSGANWARWYLGDAFKPAGSEPVGQSVRDLIVFEYLGDTSLAGASIFSGLGLDRIHGYHSPANRTALIFDNTPTAAFDALRVAGVNTPTQNGDVTNYKGWVQYPMALVNNDVYGDKGGNYTNKNRTVSKVNSQAFVWQGQMFDGTIVPMVGWRKDTEVFRSAGVPNKTLGIVTESDSTWTLPTSASTATARQTYSKETGESLTWSVVAKTPKFVNDVLPWGMKLTAFYNKSENFRPDAGRVDILGHRVASPNGKTKDYGFTVSALNDKIVLKINWYETKMFNATLTGQVANSYLIGAGEAWCQAAAIRTRDGTGGFQTVYGTSTSGGAVRWQPAGNGTVGAMDGNPGSYSQAELDAQYAIQKASVDAWLANPIPVDMQKAWGMTDYATGGGSWSQIDVAITGDTTSKGTEYELTANPLTGWDIQFTASKNDSVRLNLAKSYSDWLEGRYAFYKGPGGDVRMWGAGNWAIPADSGGTARSKFEIETLGSYKMQLALNGADVAELRPWRFAFTTNYRFQTVSFLKGVNVGGSYRWMDKITIGYPVFNDPVKGWQFDVKNPWKGPSEDAYDLWVGYERNITEKIKWRIQFNARNVFGSRKLIPITVQPDGSAGAFRLPEPVTWTLTNTFSF